MIVISLENYSVGRPSSLQVWMRRTIKQLKQLRPQIKMLFYGNALSAQKFKTDKGDAIRILRFAFVKDTVQESIEARKENTITILDCTNSTSGQKDYNYFYVSTSIKNAEEWERFAKWRLLINGGANQQKRFGVQSGSQEHFIDSLLRIVNSTIY